MSDTDPAEWIDDYYLGRMQYDEELITEANLELTMLRNQDEG